MEIRDAKLECYRRFAEPTTVRLNEGLIAVVGPNEAGKSSFLDALEELNDEDEIPDFDATRYDNCGPTISATFTLDGEDQEELIHLDRPEELTEYTVTKKSEGEIDIETDVDLSHDLEPRKNALDRFNNIIGDKFIKDQIHGNKLSEIQSTLQLEKTFLGYSDIRNIKEFSQTLAEVVENSEEEIDEKETYLEVAELLKQLSEHEDQCIPYRTEETLRNLQPRFVPFDEADRQLQNTYDLEKYGNSYPDALANLAELADLDLDELREAAMEGERSTVFTLTRDANRTLEDEFSKSWVQEEVVPVIDVDSTVLHLHVQTQDRERHSPIEERSDGLRWFVALVCFLNSKNVGRNPILLVDEAEQHLSYDAQASLIEVLESQELAPTVIYTTHSAGCLPSDLGRGIRPILPDEEMERSTIKNGFWREGEGFSPLMIAMGLKSFAFTVSRNSLIGEGPCECILLPSLIREATSKQDLRYQVAPGAATAGGESLDQLLSESGRTAFIVDGDDGGEQLREDLEDSGADADQIISYADFVDLPIVLEDLVRPDIYVEAVNEELRQWQSEKWDDSISGLTVEDLPEYGIDNAVQEWCEEHGFDPIQKTTLCQRLADKAGTGSNIVDSERQQILQEIDSWIVDRFGLT